MNRIAAPLLTALFTLAAALTLGSCVDHAPAYPTSILVYDEGLLGEWLVEGSKQEPGGKPEDPIPVAVTRRDASVTAGRLGQHNGKDKGVTPAYRLTLTLPEEAGDADSPPKPARPWAYNAVLLKVDGAELIAYEPSADRLPEGLHMDFLPVHRVMKLERTKDGLVVRWMKQSVVWVPGVEPLAEERGEPALRDAKGALLVADPDRLVKVLALALKDPAAWDEETLLLRRPDAK